MTGRGVVARGGPNDGVGRCPGADRVMDTGRCRLRVGSRVMATTPEGQTISES